MGRSLSENTVKSGAMQLRKKVQHMHVRLSALSDVSAEAHVHVHLSALSAQSDVSAEAAPFAYTTASATS
jgi:hypothetical protein